MSNNATSKVMAALSEMGEPLGRELVNAVVVGPVIAEGKTKVVYGVRGHPDRVILGSKDDITKHDDPSQTRSFGSKAVYATTTTCNVFELLVAAGIPCAYRERISPTEFVAPRCRMVPLEVIARRYAVGSYLKRNPHLATADDAEPPFRFHRLKFELFLKTTKGKFVSVDGSENALLVLDNSGRIVDDPLIADHSGEVWKLWHPKVPEWESRCDASIELSIPADEVLPAGVTVAKIEEITRRTFLVLEGAWTRFGLRLIDFKIEFGIDPDGELVVADVIDNDSWRLRTSEWQELSKENFRQNVDLDIVADKYALVAELSRRFGLSKQALVLWRGSANDECPQSHEISGMVVKDIVCSGHKSTSIALRILEDLLAEFPEGGVIVAVVGMSDGLGPVLAARTNWPIIAVPATAGNRPHDVWSSLEMPSAVPLMTVLSPKNAMMAAINILAQKNPIAYMHRQYAIELLDE